MLSKRAIPNAFTLGNLYCGFLSIGYTMQGEIRNGAILILIAMMLDAMDGRIARILNVSNDMGKELDSLADIVTFGVASAFLIYSTLFYQFGMLGYYLAGIFPLFGAYRLARFNIKSTGSDKYFTGIPITAAGGIVALMTLLDTYINSYVSLIIYILLAILMVSTIKIPSLKDIPLPKYVFIVSAFLVVAIFVFFNKKHHEVNTFIYISIFVYIAYLITQWIKNRENN